MINCYFEDGNKASPGLRHVVIDSLIIKDNKILLVKRSKKLTTGAGKWSLVGGFVSRDESLKETVAREAKEETGYSLGKITLFAINQSLVQPENDRQNIRFVFLCEPGVKVGDSDWEVSQQKWFNLDELPSKEEMAFDHLEDILLYKTYLDKPFPLPYY